MSPDRGGLGDPIEWRLAAQGDILDLPHLAYWVGDADTEQVETPHGVVLLSQTCDLVQDRERVLIAPVAECPPGLMSQVQKGRKPLLIALGTAPDRIADLERMLSVPRTLLSGATVLQHSVQERSGEEADRLSARIGRGLYRFAFPDAVHDALGKLQKKIADGYAKETSFATVLRLVDEFRISCTAWETPGRELSITALVPERYLPPADMRDPGWKWGQDTVVGLKNSEMAADINLERVSQLILSNIEKENDAAVVVLWELWAGKLADSVLPAPDAEVTSISLEVMSDTEYTFAQYKSSEVLDFSTLSNSSSE